MILTTNYSTAARAFSERVYRVRISRTAPQWCPVHDKIEALYPDAALLAGYKNATINKEQYTEVYLAQLDANKTAIIAEMTRIKRTAGDRAILLLCWCGKNRFCHRRLFSAWWEQQTGEQIQEL